MSHDTLQKKKKNSRYVRSTNKITNSASRLKIWVRETQNLTVNSKTVLILTSEPAAFNISNEIYLY